MSVDPQVIIVGAGPTGLTLAAELAGAGVRCRVVEQRPQRSRRSRAFSLTPHTLELLAMRGQADAMIARGLPWRHGPLGVDDRTLDFGLVDSAFNFMLIIPQNRIEEELERWAVESGAEIARGVRVTGLDQDAEGVTVLTERGERSAAMRAQFVVGCDGVHSGVRSLAGIPFAGSGYDVSLIVADVRLDNPPDPPVCAATTQRGMVAVFPFGDGTYRLVILDHELMSTPALVPVTLDEITRSAAAILGRDLGIHAPIWMSRYRSEQRQATHYRSGRVLLAGDAAHTHIPSGGQGLQVGMQDAFNLGWKLAAEVWGRAPDGLLDSYAHERMAVGAATLRKTDLAFRYEISRSATLRALRWVFVRLMAYRRLQLVVLNELCGLALRYPPESRRGAHELVGRRAPDLRVETAPGETRRLYDLLRARRFVLLDGTADQTFAAEARGNPQITIAGGVQDRAGWPDAVLVRPDGYVVWARARRDPLSQVIERWCVGPAALAALEAARDDRASSSADPRRLPPGPSSAPSQPVQPAPHLHILREGDRP